LFGQAIVTGDQHARVETSRALFASLAQRRGSFESLNAHELPLRLRAPPELLAGPEAAAPTGGPTRREGRRAAQRTEGRHGKSDSGYRTGRRSERDGARGTLVPGDFERDQARSGRRDLADLGSRQPEQERNAGKLQRPRLRA